jgi:hypothetical protein
MKLIELILDLLAPEPPRDPIDAGDFERVKFAMQVLLEQYKLYAGHLNSVFNYYIVLAGLGVNAYVLSLKSDANLPLTAPLGIAAAACVVSVLFWLLDARSRVLVGHIEGQMAELEQAIYGARGGFVTSYPRPRGPLQRHGFLFPAIYLIFVAGFALLALHAGIGLAAASA